MNDYHTKESSVPIQIHLLVRFLYYSSLINIVYSLQLLESIQASVSGIEESMITSSVVSNLERSLEVVERPAAEQQFDLVSKSL